MIAWLCAGLAASLIGGLAWRRHTLAADPSSWPDDLSLEDHVALVKRYLRRQGWKMGEPLTWINVFVRASRDGDWVNLIIHSKRTLSLPFLVQDFVQRTSERRTASAVMTREFVSPELRHEAARYGLFMIRPEELAHLDEHMRQAATRSAEIAQSLKSDATCVVATATSPATVSADQVSDGEPFVVDRSNMSENVRLVIWDLDETFWHGTLTEGGITIKAENCELIRQLARRGIVSSICSKNSFEDVKTVLERAEVWDYFVFPSISWETKGPRVASIVEAAQLRPATVMFIDDNPQNLNEVRYRIPDIQVQSHEFIPQISADPSFKGKADPEMTRLQQYKLLEKRQTDMTTSGGDNTDFLRSSDIRVYIEYDVASHLDRAIELINRTNQLNYTKRRLPENIEDARRILSDQLNTFSSQAGLVRVIDRYGDHGFVGFYLANSGRSTFVENTAWRRLVHYCFSCRTLGMFIEQWLYEFLQFPELTVKGEVLTDLTIPRAIDWVRLVSSIEADAAPVRKVAPEIRIHGGCEAHALAHYLHGCTDMVRVTGNFASGGLFVRLNSATLLLSACNRATPEFRAEAERLGVPHEAMSFDYFGSAPEGSMFVFKGGMDETGGEFRYRHAANGWEIKVEPDGLATIDLIEEAEEACLKRIDDRNFPAAEKIRVVEVVKHLRRDYVSVKRGNDKELVRLMTALCDRIPDGSKLVILLSPERGHFPDGTYRDIPWRKHYNDILRNVVATCPFAATLSFGDYLEHESDDHGAGHFSRMVYHRLASAIASISHRITPKTKNEKELLVSCV